MSLYTSISPEELSLCITSKTNLLLNFGINAGESTPRVYKDLFLVHNACVVRKNGSEVTELDIVAHGMNGAGPFRFLWPDADVPVFQPACLGMPVLFIESVTSS